MRWLAIGAVLAISACASPGTRYQARLDGYIGEPEAKLVAGMGEPQRTQALADGSRVLRYSRARTVPYGGRLRTIPGDGDAKAPPRTAATDYPSGTFNPSGLQPEQAASRDAASACTLNFTVDAGGTVRSWRAQGEDCRLQ